MSLFLLYFTFKMNLKSQCGIMLQFTSVSIESSFMKTRRVEGREILLAKVICTLIYIVKKSPEKLTKHVRARVTWNFTIERERGGMFQVRIMLELRFFTSEILHLNGLVSSVTPMHKVWSRFYNRPFCHLQSQQRPINLCNFNWAGQQI